MLVNLPNFRLISALAFTIISSLLYGQSPTSPAQNFNVFTSGNATLTTNESEGPVAIGGDLVIAGNYQVALHSAGTFMVSNVKIGLLVNGKVNYQGGNSLQVNSNGYVKIGNPTGSTVWYADQNNATPPIRITPNSNYNSSPKIMLQASAPSLGVSVNNNPVFQSNLLDFPAAFQTMKASSLSISQCTSNVHLTNPNGQSIPSTNLPHQVKINMQNGINYWNISAADLNAVQVLTFNNKPSASKVLVINVNAAGTFNWHVWNQAGVGFSDAPFIMYNFYNTTQLNINNGATTVGTVFAPFAHVFKGAGNQSNIQGQVIAKSFIHSGGEVHYAIFSPTVVGCAAVPVAGVPPTAIFNVNTGNQCLNSNSFTFTNTSGTYICANATSMETFSTAAAAGSQFNGLYFSAEGRSGNNALNGTFEADIHHINPYTIKSQADFVWPNNQNVPFTIKYNPNALGPDKFVYTLGTGLTQKTMKFDPTTENYPLDINAIWFYSRTAVHTTVLISDLIIENTVINGSLGAQNPTSDTFTNVVFRGGNAYVNGFIITGKAKFAWTGSIPQNSGLNFNFKIGNVTCTPEAVVQSNAPLSYLWEFGDGTTSTLMNPTKIYAAAGTYTVKLTATNTYGSDVKTMQVVVNGITNAAVTQSTIASNPGSAIRQFVLTNSLDFTNFSWSVSNGGSGLFPNQGTVSFTFTQAGYYEVTLTAADANGCQTTTFVPVTIASEEVNTGNGGGIESESLGDIMSRQYVSRKMKSIPTIFVKSEATRFDKAKLAASSNMARGGTSNLTMTEMFPTELQSGDVADITSPTDILDFTIAQEVLSVDFSIQGATKGVVLGVRTKDKVYNHTKASCDRLRGAEILNVKTVAVGGYNFLMQAIEQRNGVTEYAISFAVGKNYGDNFYTLQTNWFVKEYTPSKDVYNFQVWATLPAQSIKLVNDILNNLTASIPVFQTEVQKVPKTYAAKVSREGTELVLKLKSLKEAQSIEIVMDQNYSETNGFTHRYNPIRSEITQTIRINVDDAYEFDGLIYVEGVVQEAFYSADGNWGLDFDTTYTLIDKYLVSNNLDRVYEEGELAINRNVNLEVHSEDDYATLYKSLLPGQIPADYNEYKFVSFKAKGSGLLELGLIKSSIQNWKHQYKAMLNVGTQEQTYYVPFKFLKSTNSNQPINADDLTMLTFTFLPVEAKTHYLDLTIEDVKFTNKAPDGYEELLYTMQNEFMVYPNPSRGNVNCLLYSDTSTTAVATLYDVSGKAIYSSQLLLTAGRNELDFNFNVPTGVLFFSIKSDSVNYGTSKIFFK